MLARDAATIDVLSDGRLEFGIGTGWMRADYEQSGLSFDSPGVRVSRFEEAVSVIKGLFGPDPVTFSGKYYTIDGLNGLPKPLQRPHPPILIGAGGRRMLSIAAREADIVSVVGKTTAEGTIDFADGTAQAFDQKVDRLRQAAGKRFDELELHTYVLFVNVTDDREGAALQLAKQWNLDDSVISVPELLEAPWALIGSEDRMVEEIQARRERFGFSYLTINAAQSMDAFAPIVARLAGT
jgi:probable F420-dependent oxidoreductase